MPAIANVLTGIMGATMTIGLALAGGSQMGPRLHEAVETSKAAMVMSAIRQTGAAAAMAKTIDGEVPTGLDGVRRMVSSGWLSAIPDNPTSDQPAGAPTVSVDAQGSGWVVMPLVGDDGELCDAVARQAGSAAPERTASSRAGCVETGSGRYAYSRI